MIPANSTISIKLKEVPLLNRFAYQVDYYENNPTITLLRGHTYQLLVDTPDIHKVWIKSSLGLHNSNSFNLGITGNGSTTITWRVDQNTPARLVYQSWSSTQISGGIQIVDQSLSQWSDTINIYDLRDSLNNLENSLLYKSSDLAGQGLKFDQGKLTLNPSIKSYLKDSLGNLYSTQSTFDIDDSVNISSGFLDLQGYLNYLATLLKQVKGTQNYYSQSSSLLDIQTKLDSLESEITRLGSLI